MSIHISCDMYLRLVLHMQIRLYCVLPYKAKISAQHGIGFILDRCIVYLGLTMPNLQKKRLLIFEIFNIKKCTLFFFLTEYITSICLSFKREIHPTYPHRICCLQIFSISTLIKAMFQSNLWIGYLPFFHQIALLNQKKKLPLCFSAHIHKYENQD